MMRRIVVILSMVLLCGASFSAPLSAKLTRQDGRTWRVVLMDCNSDQLTFRIEKEQTARALPLSDIKAVNIEIPTLDLKGLRAKIAATDYAEVVNVLEPAVGATGPYMVIPNNVVDAFSLLTKAWLRNGDYEKAADGAEYLLAVKDEGRVREARSIQAQAVLETGDLSEAKALIGQLNDPVAKLYLTARVQRAEEQSKAAMETVIELIATHPNDLNWMPQTEYLCAQLYMDLDMLKSAQQVARHTAMLYPQSEYKIEAERLQEQIKELTEQSEKAQ